LVVGTDLSFDMLALCRQNLPKNRYKHRFLINADAEKLCFKNAHFNCLISLGLLDYLPDYRLVLKEFYRILKPQGTALFTIPKKPSIFFFFRTGIGINLRKMLFNLPPVLTTVTQKELLSTLVHLNFKLEFIDSLWSTMWIVKVTKTYSPEVKFLI
jgi:ubiquinone/menaquinone biosynthesis C-methylase UbiE